MSPLHETYRYFRSTGRRAVNALEAARGLVAEGKLRYATPREVIYNPPYTVPGERHVRWIENAAEGLRFTGYADEIARLDHKGWFIDDFQDETYRGVVYQLPTHKGVQRFAYGYADPNNGEAACLSFDCCDEKEQAALWADDFASRAAEREREYREESAARCRYDDMGCEMRDLRKKALAMLAEGRSHDVAVAIKAAPTIRATLCAHLRAVRAHILALRAERAELVEQFDHTPGWRDAAEA